MTQLLNVTLDVSTSSNIATVTSGENINNLVIGDYVKLEGIDLFLSVQAINGSAITLSQNSPVTNSAIRGQLIPGLVDIRSLATDVRESNEFASSIFGQLDFFLTELGTVDIQSPSGSTTINTLPQILENVSEASEQITASLTLIGNAPTFAQQAIDAALDAEVSNQSSITNANRSASEADQAALEKQAVLDEGQRINGVANNIATLETQTAASANSAAQSVTDATEQVGLAQAQVTVATTLRDQAASSNSQAQQAVVDAQAAVADAQAIAGGNFATVQELEQVNKRAIAGAASWL
jgi:hypothetical protein